MNILKILAILLLSVGLVACEDDSESIGISDPVTTELAGFGYLSVETVANFGSTEGNFTVRITGDGNSNIWDDYQLEMEHREWHTAGNDRYVITSGLFELVDPEGEQILLGSYSGQGLMDGNQRREMSLVVNITENRNAQIQLVNNSFRLTLHDFGEQGECCFTMKGECQSYGSPL